MTLQTNNSDSILQLSNDMVGVVNIVTCEESNIWIELRTL